MHVSLGEQLGEALGAAIIRGDYCSGNQLPTEHALCQRHKVSRGAVREAIKVLASKGLVESRRRQGTIVTPVREWNLLDPDILTWMRKVEYSHRLLHELVQVRQAIEPEACAIVAERHQRVDFSELVAAVAQMDRDDIDEPTLLAADTAFHVGILKATGNRFLQQFEHLISTTLCFGYDLIELYKLYQTERKINAAEHREILELMQAGRVTAARRANRAMIERITLALEQLMVSAPTRT